MNLYVPFLECFKDATGGNQKVKQSEYEDDGLPVIDQGKNLIGGYSTSARKVKRTGELIVFGDHSGTIKFIDFDFALGADGVKVIEPDYDKVYPKYAFYALNKVYIPNTGYDRKYKYLKRSKIPLPPLPIQQKIAEVLDKADAIRKRSQLILERYDQLAQSTFLEMFGDPVKNEKGWEVELLQGLTSKITDGEHGTVKRVEFGKLYLMARNVSKYGNLDLSEVSYISETDHNRIYKRCDPEFEDLLLVCVGATIGKCTLVPRIEPFSLARSVALIKPSRELVNPHFLVNLFRTDYLKLQLFQRSNSSAQAGLYTGQIKKLKIPVPPITLQNQFATIIHHIEKQKAQTQAELTRAEELYQSLLQRAFKGGLFDEELRKEAIHE